MRIAILYICTGKYNQFFPGLYSSAKKYLLKGQAELEFFVWSDDNRLSEGHDDVHLIYKECEGFPADSLFRFRMFLQVKDKLQKYDYIYFLNANAKFCAPVGVEILPDETGLVAALWPCNHGVLNHSFFYPYERNKKSLAYVPPFDGPYKYYMGGINGGKSADYLAMIEELYANIEQDYRNGIVAVVHDESHLNHYLHKHKCKILPKQLAWPEEWKSSFTPKLIFRDKKVLDGYFVKGRDRSLCGKVKYLLGRIKWAISWYM